MQDYDIVMYDDVDDDSPPDWRSFAEEEKVMRTVAGSSRMTASYAGSKMKMWLRMTSRLGPGVGPGVGVGRGF